MPNATDSMPPGWRSPTMTDPFEPPLPTWVVEAQEESLRSDLAAAVRRPVDGPDLMLLRLLDPEGLAEAARRSDTADANDGANAGVSTGAGGDADTGDAGNTTRRGARTGPDAGIAARTAAQALLDGIVVAQRIADYANAVQQRLLAAFCRPGVAVPISDLLDLGGDHLAAALTAAVDEVTSGREREAQGETACHAVGGASGRGVTPDAKDDGDVRDPSPCADAVRSGQPGDARPADHSPDALVASAAWECVLRNTAIKTASAEVACALHLAPVTARLRCENATEFVDHLPATLAAQERGEIDPYRARLVLERVEVLPPHLHAHVERRVLPSARAMTAASFRRLIDREVIAADPAAARRRQEQAKSRRDVFASRGDDGAGIFTAVVSAADAELAFRLLDTMAASVGRTHPAGSTDPTCPAEKRSRGQLRADAFTDLFRTLADTGCVSIAHPAPATDHPPRKGTTCPTGDLPRDVTICGHHGTGSSRDGNSSAATDGAADTDSVVGTATTSTRSAPAGTVVGTTGTHGTAATGTAADSPAPRAPSSMWCGDTLPIGRTGAVVGVRRPVALNVYLDAATLAGFDDRPGELSGFGAITAETARALAASADTVRSILVRPADGNRACDSILDAGRAIYRPPDPAVDYVTTRDRTCCFPGCRMPAARCDLDHRVPFDSGGDTCPCNLDALCRHHHRLKTFTAWRAIRDPETDRLTWTSPLGRTYGTEQPHLLLAGAAAVAQPDAVTASMTATTAPTTTATAATTAAAADEPPPF